MLYENEKKKSIIFFILLDYNSLVLKTKSQLIIL